MKISFLFTAPALLFTVFAASAQVRSVGEFAVAAPEIASAPYAKGTPAVAGNGNEYFAVWRDSRSGRTESLIGARISATGQLLDPVGIHIADFADASRVIWSGDAWLVVWSVSRASEHSAVVASRISRDGVVLDTKTIAQGSSQLGSILTTNGSRTVVLYTRSTTRSEIRAAVLDLQANVVADHQLAPPDADRYHLSITTVGNEFFAAWNNTSAATQGTIEGIRLDAAGTPIGTRRLLGSGYDPEVTSSGSDLLVLFRHRSNDSLIWSTRQVRGDLQAFASPRILPRGGELFEPRLVRSGNGYVVIAQQLGPTAYQVTATRLDSAGLPIDDEPRALASLPPQGIAPMPVAATNGSNLLAVYIAGTLVNQEVRAQLVDAGTLAAKGAEVTLSRSARLQITPAVASSGTNQLVVWREPGGIFASRIAPDGRPLDGPGFFVGGSRTVTYPSVVFDGKSYVVAWSDQGGTGIVVRFIDPQTTLGPELRAPGAWSQVAMATSGEATIILWTEYDDGKRRIYGMRVGRDSQRVEIGRTPISPADHEADGAAISWNGREFLVAWLELVEFEDGGIIPYPSVVPARIRGTRLSPALAVHDPIAPVFADAPGDGPPKLAALDGDWLLVWTADDYTTVRARRIGRGLALYGDAAGLNLGLGKEPAVTSDGSRFIVAQRDGYNSNLTVTYLTRDLVQTGRLTFDAGNTAIPRLALAPAQDGLTALVYSRISHAPEHGGVERTFLRLLAQAKKPRAVR